MSDSYIMQGWFIIRKYTINNFENEDDVVEIVNDFVL